jgi:hypothetical protein
LFRELRKHVSNESRALKLTIDRDIIGTGAVVELDFVTRSKAGSTGGLSGSHPVKVTVAGENVMHSDAGSLHGLARAIDQAVASAPDVPFEIHVILSR